MTKQPFVNTYLGCEQRKTDVRVQTFVDTEDYEFLRLIRTNTGTITTTVNLLFKKLIDELKKRGITDITKRSEFEFFVANSKLVLEEEQTTNSRKRVKEAA